MVNIANIEASAILEVSTDGGENYVEATSIEIIDGVPGDIYYYRLLIENTGNIDIHCQVALDEFTDSAADPLGDTTNFDNNQTLLDVIRITTSNTINTEALDAELMSDLLAIMPSGLVIAGDLELSPAGTVYLYFTFTIDSLLAGNDFQNLKLIISSISISSQR